MANDADLRKLTMRVNELERSVSNLTRVLEALNTNFVEFLREIKEKNDGN
jgi:hypothetical protein